MKAPSCTVCQVRYDEDERVPLLLQCGHGFCKDCLSRMFAASPENSLSCPRCRHASPVGNSVHALRKNFAVLALLRSSANWDDDSDDDGGGCGGVDGEEDEGDGGLGFRSFRSRCCSSAGECIDLAGHQGLRLLRPIANGPGGGQDVWEAVLSGGRGAASSASAAARGCRHRVAVKRVAVSEEMDLALVQSRLESLRRASMWCRNVCAFHGVTRMEGRLCLVMERYAGSVLSEMQRNSGRLTLEQILRYGADIARGVAELHAAGIVCMNLKPSNLLLDGRGRAVVSDYGLPKILKKPSCRNARLGPDDDSLSMHFCMDCAMLSPHYTAPEAWEPLKKSLNIFRDDGIGISTESDAWSFGCTLVEMCTGYVPWAGYSSDEIYKAVVKDRRLPPQYASVVGVGLPRELWKMIGECLQFKSNKRPTFHSMLSIFLHHLQEIPHSPPASPDNDLLKDHGTNVMEPSPTSVLDGFEGNPKILHQLVSEGDLDGIRNFLSKAAVENGYSIESLLEAQNSDGQTALHLACRRGFVKIVEQLLDYKQADVDILDKDGDPPIVYALAAGSAECVHVLIERCANVSSRLREGFGPSIAHVCAFHGHPDCMRELLMAGADPNAVDDEGETVLHRAIAKKYTECAIVILENGGCKSMGVMNSKNLTRRQCGFVSLVDCFCI